jgi:transketolase
MPADVLDTWRAAGRRSAREHAAWTRRVAALPAAERVELEQVLRGESPAGWRDVLLAYKRGAVEGNEPQSAS